jgi:hypothetical protein
MEVDYLDLVGEGYMGSMQWQLGRELVNFLAYASSTLYRSDYFYY